jgi:hypothetical protein
MQQVAELGTHFSHYSSILFHGQPDKKRGRLGQGGNVKASPELHNA